MQHSFVRSAVCGITIVAVITIFAAQPASALGLGSGGLSVTNPVTQQVGGVTNVVAPVTNDVTQTVDGLVTSSANPPSTDGGNTVTQLAGPIANSVGPTVNQVGAPVTSIVNNTVTTAAMPLDNDVDGVVNDATSSVASIGTALSLNSNATALVAGATASAFRLNAPPIVTVTSAPPVDVATPNVVSPFVSAGSDAALADVTPPVEQLPATFSRAVVVVRPPSSPALSRAYLPALTPDNGFDSAIRNAATYSFPIGMMLALIGFVLLNGRIDHNEAKLRQSPAPRTRRDAVTFS